MLIYSYNYKEGLLSAFPPSKGDSKRFTVTSNLNKDKNAGSGCTVCDDENVTVAVVGLRQEIAVEDLCL